MLKSIIIDLGNVIKMSRMMKLAGFEESGRVDVLETRLCQSNTIFKVSKSWHKDHPDVQNGGAP